MTARRTDAGFSLIEALVALVVLAVAGIALVGATETHVRRIAMLEDRAAAQWVAENHMAELAAGALPLGRSGETDIEVAMLERAWTLRRSVTGTDDPELAQIVLVVGLPDGAPSLARLTGFLPRGEP